MRLELDDKGKVTNAWIVEHAGESFDDTALTAVREKCRFTAALDERGRPIACVIDDYRFHFRAAAQPAPTHFLIRQ
jgi:hypothetical protein